MGNLTKNYCNFDLIDGKKIMDKNYVKFCAQNGFIK